MLDLLKSDDPDARWRGLDGLARETWRSEKAIPEITKALKDEFNFVRREAVTALGHTQVGLLELGKPLKPEILAGLETALSDPDAETRRRAAKFLADFRHDSAALVAAAADADVGVQREVARGLRFCSGPVAADALKALQGHEDADVVGHASGKESWSR